MDDYPNNSDNKVAEQPKNDIPEKEEQASVQATIKKKGFLTKLKDDFISDSSADIKSTVVQTIVIPKILDIITSTLHTTVDMFFYGGTKPKNDGGSKINYGGKVNGVGMYDDRVRRLSSVPSDYRMVSFDSEEDARIVLRKLKRTVEESRGRYATLLDFYDFSGLGKHAPYTYNRYGWYDLRGVDVEYDRLEDRWYIDLPRPEVV